MPSIHRYARRLAGSFCALGLFTAAASATTPAVPQVIYDAHAKQVTLDWEIVPHSNYYELWFTANAGTPAVKFDERKPWNPHWRNNVSAHLLHWSEARWEVRACNPSGCSSTGPINIGSTVVNTVGFVKAQRPVADARFGTAVAVSEDGNTMAVIASDEPVAGGKAAAAYIFRNFSGTWRQLSRFVVAGTAGDGEDASVSLSADGERVAVGLPDALVVSGGTTGHGAIYLRQHTVSGSWTQNGVFFHAGTARLGAFSKMNDAGDVIAMSDDASGGNLEIWRSHSGHWTLDGKLTSNEELVCGAFDLSSDGTKVARACNIGGPPRVEVWNAAPATLAATIKPTLPAPDYELAGLAIDYAADTVAIGLRPRPANAADYTAANWQPNVQVFRGAAPNYSLTATLVPHAKQSTEFSKRSFFGDVIAVSHAGGYVAVNDPHDSLGSHGVWPLTEQSGINGAPNGGVYLFERNGAGYRARRHIGPQGTLTAADEGVFGALAFGNDGRTLAIAQPLDNSSLSGIGPYLGRPPLEGAGAVWLY